MESFKIKTEIIFGSEPLECLSQISGGQIMVVADPFVVSSGMLGRITDRLAGRHIEVFSDVVPDPPVQSVAKGIVVFERMMPDALIAVGGGSALDTAKGIIKYAHCQKACRFIAIPTTSGTGSEVTKFAVLTDSSTNQKYPLVDDGLLPDTAILDTAFVKSVPAAVVADTGMDVLTHALEAYVSTAATAFSDAFAEKAVEYVFTYLERSYASGEDLEARERMHEASAMAGIAFNAASLGLNHAMAHNLGARLKIPHGRINSILLPYIIDYNADIRDYHPKTYTAAAEKYARIALRAGVAKTNPRQQVRGLIDSILKLMTKLNMPKSLSECKIAAGDIKAVEDRAVEGALKDACLLTNPRPADAQVVRAIIHKISVRRTV